MKRIFTLICIVACMAAGYYSSRLVAKPEVRTSQYDDHGYPSERDCWSHRDEPDEHVFGFVPPVTGAISAIDPDSQTATLNIGSDQGIAVEDRLTIRRGSNDRFAWLDVTSVEESKAQATLSETSQVVVGDKVFKDSTDLLSQSLLTNGPEFSPKALAQRQANADLAIGVRRILCCGRAPADIGTRRDEESGYPFHVNGGCVVLRELVQFNEEYNRKMREAAAAGFRMCDG